MILQDYYCPKCKHIEEDVEWNSPKDVQLFLECPNCADRRKRSGVYRPAQLMEIHHGHIKGFTHVGGPSKMYSGQSEVAFGGERIHSYSDKQRLMKKYNVIEASDSDKGSREPDYPPGYNGPGRPITPQKPEKLDNTKVLTARSQKDLARQVERENARIKSGDLKGYEALQGR